MRLAPGQRVEHRPVSVLEEPRADELVAVRVRLEPAGKATTLETRERVGCALESQQRRPDEELEPDECRDRVSGEPEDEPPFEHAERDRLSRLHRNSPEDLLDAELGLDHAHEIVRPDRDAAGGDEHVGREPAREGLAVGGLVVGDRAQPLDLGPCRLQLRGEQQPVRLIDLSRLEQLARPAKLAARREHGGPRPPRNEHLGDARRRECAELRGAEAGAGVDHQLSAAHIAA